MTLRAQVALVNPETCSTIRSKIVYTTGPTPVQVTQLHLTLQHPVAEYSHPVFYHVYGKVKMQLLGFLDPAPKGPRNK